MTKWRRSEIKSEEWGGDEIQTASFSSHVNCLGPQRRGEGGCLWGAKIVNHYLSCFDGTHQGSVEMAKILPPLLAFAYKRHGDSS